MPRPATTDWSAADHAPEYPPGAGEQVSTNNRPVVETRTEARQAVTGHNVRYVLTFGLGAVVIAFAIIYVAFWA